MDIWNYRSWSTCHTVKETHHHETTRMSTTWTYSPLPCHGTSHHLVFITITLSYNKVIPGQTLLVLIHVSHCKRDTSLRNHTCVCHVGWNFSSSYHETRHHLVFITKTLSHNRVIPRCQLMIQCPLRSALYNWLSFESALVESDQYDSFASYFWVIKSSNCSSAPTLILVRALQITLVEIV